MLTWFLSSDLTVHTGKTLRAHLVTGAEMVERSSLDLVRSHPFVLIIDESSKRVEMQRQSVIVIVCRTFLHTVLLDVVVDLQPSSGQSICDFARAAVEKARLDIAACRGLMGDGARYMNKAARLLGVTRLRCIPHGLALVAGCFMQGAVNDLVCSWKSFVNLGNANVRRKRLQQKANVLPSTLDVAPTRWGSWLDAVDALAGQWEALHEVVRSEESLSALKKMLLEQMSDDVTRGIVVVMAKSTELVRHLIVVSQGSFSVVLCFC